MVRVALQSQNGGYHFSLWQPHDAPVTQCAWILAQQTKWFEESAPTRATQMSHIARYGARHRRCRSYTFVSRYTVQLQVGRLPLCRTSSWSFSLIFHQFQGRTNLAFSKPCLCLSDARHFCHFRRFRVSEERNPCFQWVECRFVIFAVFVKSFGRGQKHGLPKTWFVPPRQFCCAEPWEFWAGVSPEVLFALNGLTKLARKLCPKLRPKLALPTSPLTALSKMQTSPKTSLCRNPLLVTFLQLWAIPPVRLGLSGRNSGKIPERPRKRSHSPRVRLGSPKPYN